ncbi:hypothetical protein A6302_02737 [Methylobrevis pamukkalensis]|uniref:Uncharacterized protein n=1 Tax=Methylobrevis pamukkalensis TaxID=1439726 RepID=A0A1E3H0Z6_9HYPH|nr:hypothetical protein A6302_02737 [Methylobrevis pamukkalensis]
MAGERGAGGHGLEAAGAAAGARFAPGRKIGRTGNDHVADLGGQTPVAAQQPAVGNHAAADAGADGDEHHGPRAAAGTEAPFAERGGIGVVVDMDRKPEARAQERGERHVPPAGQHRQGQRDPGLGIGGARHGNPRAGEGMGREGGNQRLDLADHGVRPPLRIGRQDGEGDHLAGRGDDRGA